MITRDELAQYLAEFLGVDRYSDYAPNGIQVEGKGLIKRICTAVTASKQVIDQAVTWQADALLVHHGYFWRGENPVIAGMRRQRISTLLEHELNLFAYHLPLDCHLELGNNACLAKLFSIQSVKTHKVANIEHLLWSGVLSAPMSGIALAAFLSKQLAREPLHVSGSAREINRIAWCSGAAQDYIEHAAQLGVDAYLSGEVSERTYYQAKELGLHYYSCGHHATERYGIQALGHALANTFSLEHLFIDTNNPV